MNNAMWLTVSGRKTITPVRGCRENTFFLFGWAGKHSQFLQRVGALEKEILRELVND